MKKIEAIVRPEMLEPLKNAFLQHEVGGLTISQVMGCGNQKGYTDEIRVQQVIINMLPKIMFTLVVKDEDLKKITNIIIEKAQTGEVGDGKIFISDIVDCIRIRTEEHGEDAL